MVVRFTWTSREWREAYQLSNGEQNRPCGAVPVGYLLLAVTAVGGVGDLAQTLHRHRSAMLQDSLLPMLLLVAGLGATVAAALAVLRRMTRMRGLPAMPEGEQQVIVHELGWGTVPSHEASKPPMRGWSELRGLRSGRDVLALLTWDGSTVGVPLRVLTADQGSWIERLLLRKVRQLL